MKAKEPETNETNDSEFVDVSLEKNIEQQEKLIEEEKIIAYEDTSCSNCSGFFNTLLRGLAVFSPRHVQYSQAQFTDQQIVVKQQKENSKNEENGEVVATMEL